MSLIQKKEQISCEKTKNAQNQAQKAFEANFDFFVPISGLEEGHKRQQFFFMSVVIILPCTTCILRDFSSELSNYRYQNRYLLPD
jgi:hypothetical protein